MAYLGRVVEPDRWEPSPGLSDGELSADTLTRGRSDVRTTNNTLSFYESDTSELEAAQRAALAIAAKRKTLDPVFVACLDRTALEQESIVFEHSEGDTPIRELKEQHHRDAVRLDALRLARIVGRLATAVHASTFHQWSRERVRALLQGAVDGRLVDLAQLNEDLRKELREPIR